MASLTHFGDRMKRLSDRVEPNMLFVRKKVAHRIHDAVVKTTPHKSGRARYNWNVSLNLPNHNYDYASFNGGGRTGDWARKLSTGGVRIQSARTKDSIYISNGLPYIQKLNRGYSAQAPRDFVRVASIVAIRIVRDSRILR